MFKLFTPPSAERLAASALEDAKRELLTMQARAEHATKMVEFYINLVDRLEAYPSSRKVEQSNA